MYQSNNTTPQIHQASLKKWLLAGAAIGFVLIAFFLFTSDQTDPAWGKFWMLRPLIVVPFAGAVGGLCNYLLVHFHQQLGLNKTVAVMLSGLVFIIGLFMGTVLGLDGTMWD